MRFVVLTALSALALSACASSSYQPLPPTPGPGPVIPPGPGPTPYPVPLTGEIAYSCADGSQLVVDFESNQARVAVIGGPSMVLPNAGENYYTNGRYGIRGSGAAAQWEVGRAAPVMCQGS